MCTKTPTSETSQKRFYHKLKPINVRPAPKVQCPAPKAQRTQQERMLAVEIDITTLGTASKFYFKKESFFQSANNPPHPSLPSRALIVLHCKLHSARNHAPSSIFSPLCRHHPNRALDGASQIEATTSQNQVARQPK